MDHNNRYFCRLFLLLARSVLLVFGLACYGGDATELQVEARGVGKNAEAAIKNALSNAVQQAVGAYVDQKTLIQNEAVIEDKILSVSAGFVQKYDELHPPKERSDGLWEAAVRAVVKKGEVGTALRSAGVMRVEADGRASWARQVTQIKGREDAMALIEKLVPELLPNLVQGWIVGHSNTEDPKTGEQLNHINIEYRINMEWWEKEGYPAWDAALSALQLNATPPLEMDLRVREDKLLGSRNSLPGLARPTTSDPRHCVELYRPGNTLGTSWKLKRYHLPDDWMTRLEKILLIENSQNTRAYGIQIPSSGRFGGPIVFSILCFLGVEGQPLHEVEVAFPENYKMGDSAYSQTSGYLPCTEAKRFFEHSAVRESSNVGPSSRVLIGGYPYRNEKNGFLVLAPFFSVGPMDPSKSFPFVGTKVTTQLTIKIPDQAMAEMRSMELRAASFGVLSSKPGSSSPHKSTAGPQEKTEKGSLNALADHQTQNPKPVSSSPPETSATDVAPRITRAERVPQAHVASDSPVKVQTEQQKSAPKEDGQMALLESAEVRLNTAYATLRARLDTASRERLKSDQIRWIKARESVTKEGTELWKRMASERAKELELSLAKETSR
jgi:uncharacterized protein YecT (DUF1311 family)